MQNPDVSEQLDDFLLKVENIQSTFKYMAFWKVYYFYFKSLKLMTILLLQYEKLIFQDNIYFY